MTATVKTPAKRKAKPTTILDVCPEKAGYQRQVIRYDNSNAARVNYWRLDAWGNRTGYIDASCFATIEDGQAKASWEEGAWSRR